MGEMIPMNDGSISTLNGTSPSMQGFSVGPAPVMDGTDGMHVPEVVLGCQHAKLPIPNTIIWCARLMSPQLCQASVMDGTRFRLGPTQDRDFPTRGR